MNRLPEAVTTKFTELFAALHGAADDLKLAGAEANLMGDFSQVAALNDSCRKLQAFETELETAVNQFTSNYSARSAEKAGFHKKNRNRTRKPAGRLRVKLADKFIEESTIADTFVKTLRTLGFERVARLNKVVTKVPLIARTPVVNGYQNQKTCDGWYITTHVNKHTAATVLEEIGKDLNTPLKVEFIER